MGMKNIFTAIQRLVDRAIEVRALRGENRYISVGGRTYDVLSEITDLKKNGGHTHENKGALDLITVETLEKISALDAKVTALIQSVDILRARVDRNRRDIDILKGIQPTVFFGKWDSSTWDTSRYV